MSSTATTRDLGVALVLTLGAALMASAPAGASDPNVRAPADSGATTKPVIRYDDGPVVAGDQAGTSYTLQGNAWSNPSLTYGYTNTTPDLGATATRAAVDSAFALWGDVSGLDFTEAPDCGIGVPPGDPGCSTPDIRVLFVGAHPDGGSFGEEGGVLAHAYYPPPNGGTIAGDAHFDEGDNWAAIDLLTVAAHEFGHSLGLAHAGGADCDTDGEYALMCPFYIGPHPSLGADDIAAIQALYGPGGSPPPPPPPPPTLPANDDFADAELLAGPTGSATTSSVDATKQSGEPAHAGNSGGRSIWYSWVAPASGTLTVDTLSSGFDTLLGVYTGTTVNALTERAANDDAASPQSLQSEVSFDVVGGTTYRIALDGYGGAAGAAALHWQFEPPAAPTFRPDGHVRRNHQTYVGNNIYNGTGAGQTRTTSVAARSRATFQVRVQNDGNVADRYKVRGTRHGTKWRVAYYSGTKNISAAVKAGNYTVSALPPGGTAVIKVVITAKSAARKGNRKTAAVTIGSVGQSQVKDTVKTVVKRR